MNIYSEINRGLSHFPHKLFLLENSHLIKNSTPHEIIIERYQESKPLTFVETFLLSDSPRDVARYNSTLEDIKRVYNSYKRLAQTLINNDFDLYKTTDIFRADGNKSSYFNANNDYPEYNNLGIHISDISTLDILYNKNEHLATALSHHLSKIPNIKDYSFLNSEEYKNIAINSIEHIISSCNDSILDLYNNEPLFFSQYNPINTLISITKQDDDKKNNKDELPKKIEEQSIPLVQFILLKKTQSHVSDSTFEKLTTFLNNTHHAINWFANINLSNESTLHGQSHLNDLNYHSLEPLKQIEYNNPTEEELTHKTRTENEYAKRTYTGPFINSLLADTNNTNKLINTLIHYIDEDVLFSHLEEINFLHYASKTDPNFHNSTFNDRASVLLDSQLNKIKEDIHGLTPIMYAKFNNIVDFLTKDNLCLYTPTSKNEYPIVYLLENMCHDSDFLTNLKKFEYKKINTLTLDEDIKINMHLQLTALLAKAIELHNFSAFDTILKIAKKYPNFSINTTDKNGDSLLMKAVSNQKYYDTSKITRLILEQDNVNYNIQNKQSQDAFALFSQNFKTIDVPGENTHSRHVLLQNVNGRKIWDNTDISKKYSTDGEQNFIDNILHSYLNPKFNIPTDFFNQTIINYSSHENAFYLSVNALFEKHQKNNKTFTENEIVTNFFYNSKKECFLDGIVKNIHSNSFSKLDMAILFNFSKKDNDVVKKIWENMPRENQINFMTILLSEKSLDNLQEYFNKNYRFETSQTEFIDMVDRMIELTKPNAKENQTIFSNNMLSTHPIFKIKDETSKTFSKFEALLIKNVCAIKISEEPKRMRI